MEQHQCIARKITGVIIEGGRDLFALLIGRNLNQRQKENIEFLDSTISRGKFSSWYIFEDQMNYAPKEKVVIDNSMRTNVLKSTQ